MTSWSAGRSAQVWMHLGRDVSLMQAAAWPARPSSDGSEQIGARRQVAAHIDEPQSRRRAEEVQVVDLQPMRQQWPERRMRAGHRDAHRGRSARRPAHGGGHARSGVGRLTGANGTEGDRLGINGTPSSITSTPARNTPKTSVATQSALTAAVSAMTHMVRMKMPIAPYTARAA